VGVSLSLSPSRLAAWWAWRQVERAAPRAEDRRALGLVLLLAFGLLIWGLDWGLIDHSWAAGVAAVLASVVFHNLAFNFGGFVSHITLLSTMDDLAAVPRTAAGYAQLTGTSVALFRWSLGWPLFVMAVVGVASGVARRDRRWWLWLLLPPLSFHLAFTWVTLYIFDRFLLGGIFVFALFGGAVCADLLEAGRWRRVRRFAVAGSFLYAPLYASSINVMMNLDARKAARSWVYAHASEDTTVAVIGRSYMPYLGQPPKVVIVDAAPEDIRRAAPDLVVLNARFAQRYRLGSSSAERALLGTG